jgi:MFS family permease
MKKIYRMYILSFFFTLHISLPAYVNSSFLAEFINEKYVGLIYTLASVSTLILLSKSANILKFIGNRKLTLTLLLLNIGSLVSLITINNPYIIGLSFIIFLSTNSLVFLCIDIFIQHFGNPLTIGKTRGLYLMIISLAWMISPLITVAFIDKAGGYIYVYILSFITAIIMIFGLLFSVKTFKDKVYKKTPFIETFRELKKNKHILAITIINFLLQFFYAWMIIYTPLYLHEHIGLKWEQIGIIFAIMLSPFVLFNMPIGIIIDKKYIRKRTLLYMGIIIMSLSTLFIPFISTQSIIIWALLLFITRTGASLIETTSEIYFFSHIKEEDASMLSIFRDMNPIAFIIAPLLSTLVFIFLPFEYLFIILGIIILIGLYYIPHLKRSHDIQIPN